MFTIDDDLLNTLSTKAKKTERRRTNFNIHKTSEDILQRFLNAMEPGTYIRPHKHENPDKRELFVLVRGKFLILEFDNDGNILDYTVLSSKNNFAAEVSSGVWHTVIALEKNSVSLEIKDGPYKQSEDKKFADWAPAEEEKENAQKYIVDILSKINL